MTMTNEEIKTVLIERKDLRNVFRELLTMGEPMRTQAVKKIATMLKSMKK